MSGLIEILMTEVLRLVMPHECYIYVKSRHPLLVALIGIALGLPLSMWVVFTGMMLFMGLGSMRADELWSFLLFAIAPVVVLLAVKLLLKKFWKPTPEMISHNDAMVKKEIAEMEKQADEEAARKKEKETAAEAAIARGLPPPDDEKRWVCPSCGKRNDTSEYACTRCGRSYALWGQAAPLEDVEQ